MNAPRILSIDPGTTDVGFAILEDTGNGVLVVDVHTLHADKVLGWRSNQLQQHPVRTQRLEIIHGAVYKLLANWNVSAVICESPYFKLHVQSYAALVECMSYIRRASYLYDPYLEFITVEPAVAKAAVGAAGNKGDKDAVAKAVGTNKNIDLGEFNIMGLDQHSVDAIAIGFTYAKDHWLRNKA